MAPKGSEKGPRKLNLCPPNLEILVASQRAQIRVLSGVLPRLLWLSVALSKISALSEVLSRGLSLCGEQEEEHLREHSWGSTPESTSISESTLDPQQGPKTSAKPSTYPKI